MISINELVLTAGPGLTKTPRSAAWPPPLGLKCDRMCKRECEAVHKLSSNLPVVM